MSLYKLFASLSLVAASGSAFALPIPAYEFNFSGSAVTANTGSQAITMSRSGPGTVVVNTSNPSASEGKAAVFSNSAIRSTAQPNATKGDFTVAFWMKTSSVGPTGSQWWSGSGLVDAEAAGATSDWGISYLNNRVAFGIGGPDITLQSSRAVNDDAWHLVSASWQMSTGTMSLYLDGLLNATTTNTGAKNQMRNGENILAIGRLATDVNAYYNGSLAHIQIFDSVLSAAQITEIANGSTVPEPSSIALLGLAGIAGLVARRRRA